MDLDTFKAKEKECNAMQLSISDQTKYPHFTQYVKFAVPKLKTITKIVTNVALYGGLTQTEFNSATTWGNSPMIVITDLHNGQCGVPKAYGCFRPAKPTNIEIHIGTVTDFENSRINHTDKNKSGNLLVYVVGATLLHELCHWGNYNNIPRIPELSEMGAEFEKNTYGKIIY